MMKIDGISSGQRSVQSVHGDVSHLISTESTFSDELSQRQGSRTREELEQLLKKIDEQGARLTKTPTYDELRAYRSLVQEFVGEAVSMMYEVTTSSGWDRMGRQKAYTTVKKIDEELEKMAEHIRLGHADSLSIIASQDAIRGMLVDLYS